MKMQEVLTDLRCNRAGGWRGVLGEVGDGGTVRPDDTIGW